MATRSIRKQPFCWQEKKILRLIKLNFKKSELAKMLLLYQVVTWIDSDFNGKDIKFYTKTISTYSGLSVEFIPKGLNWLQDHRVLRVVQDSENGRFKGKRLIFTPEEAEEVPQETVAGFSDNGKSISGKTDTSEDSILLEDSKSKKIVDLQSPPLPIKEIVSYLNERTGRNFSQKTVDTIAKIKARFNDGFTVEDFKKVIDGRVAKWLNDPKMDDKLRPETLFGNKFEGYLMAYKPPNALNKIETLIDSELTEDQTHQFLEYQQHIKDNMPKLFASVQILKASEYFAIRPGGGRWDPLRVQFVEKQIKEKFLDAHKKLNAKAMKGWGCENVIELLNKKLSITNYA